MLSAHPLCELSFCIRVLVGSQAERATVRTMNMREAGHRSVVHVKKLQQASRRLEVIPHDPEHGVYLVTSAIRPDVYYEVVLDPDRPAGRCTCPWAQYGGINCKHVLAALQTRYAAQGRLSFWRSPNAARRQHRRLLIGDQLYITLRPRVQRFSEPDAKP